MNALRPEQRYTASRPCPICGRTGRGATPHCHGFETDNDFVYCTSDDHANGAELNEKCEPPAYLHKREQDGSYRPWTPEKPTPIRPARRAHAAPPKAHTSEAGTRCFSYGHSQRVRRIDEAGKDKDIKPQYYANGQWYIGEGPGEIEYIYRRAEIAEQPDEPLHIFEGETCAEAGAALGLRAMTWRGGTGRVNKAIEHIIAVCTGQHVVLHKDSDQPGRKAMEQIAAAIAPVAASVKMVDYFPDEDPDRGGRDIEDWLAEGGSADDLMQLIADAPEYEPAAVISAWSTFVAQNRVDLAKAINEGIEQPTRLVDPVLLEGRVHCIFGGPEQGKTLLLLHFILSVLRQGKRVMFFDEEIGTNETAERLEAMGANTDDLNRLFYFPFALINSLDEMAALILEGIQQEGITFVGLDSISKALAAAGLDENSNSDCTKFMRAWVTPASHQYGATVVYLDHIAKVEDDGSYSRGASSKLADTDVQWHIKATVAPTRVSMGRLVLTKKKDRTATVPSTVRYVAGGDGSGTITIGLEASDFIAPVRVSKHDEKYVSALYGESNAGMTFAEWEKATGAKYSTFRDLRRRLVNSGAVVQDGDRYFVSESGAKAYGCDPQVSTVQYGSGTDVPNRTSGNGSTVWYGVLKAPYQTVLTGQETQSTSERLWAWICDIHAGRVDDAPEAIRQAAQQAGFTFDTFVPIRQEADRLGAHLDAVGSDAADDLPDRVTPTDESPTGSKPTNGLTPVAERLPASIRKKTEGLTPWPDGTPRHRLTERT